MSPSPSGWWSSGASRCWRRCPIPPSSWRTCWCRAGATGPSVDAVVTAAARRGVPLRRVTPDKVGRVSGSARHDQGVVATIQAPAVGALADWTAPPAGFVLLLDGVTNPANVGMIVRTAVAAGAAALVLPRAGSPDVGPLVVKASAGVALHAPILRCATAADGVRLLHDAGFTVIGLRADAAASLWSVDLPERVAFVLGNESEGLSAAVVKELDGDVGVPLAGGVESLNVAVAAGVLCYELARRRSTASPAATLEDMA